jgi:hypothetical protein
MKLLRICGDGNAWRQAMGWIRSIVHHLAGGGRRGASKCRFRPAAFAMLGNASDAVIDLREFHRYWLLALSEKTPGVAERRTAAATRKGRCLAEPQVSLPSSGVF